MRKVLLDKVLKVGLLLLVVLALATGLAVPTMMASAAGPAPGTEYASTNQDATSVQGNIAAISGNSITITPSNGNFPVTLTMDSNTNIDLHGLDSLAVGQDVIAVYNNQTMLAEKITVRIFNIAPGID
jgi:hypothetical protein